MRKKPANLTFKQRLEIVSWLATHHEKHLRERPSFVDAAVAAGKAISAEVSPKSIASIAKDSGLTWEPAFHSRTRDSVVHLEAMVVQLAARCDRLETQLLTLYHQLGVDLPKPQLVNANGR